MVFNDFPYKHAIPCQSFILTYNLVNTLVNTLEHDRCAQAKILHIAVDTQSEVRIVHLLPNMLWFRKVPNDIIHNIMQEGTVYIKTLSTEEAGKVFG